MFSKRESVLVALIKVLECADKRCILPKQKNLFPNGRMCFQSVDKVSLTKYDEDTIKTTINCYDNRNKLREEFQNEKNL